MLEGAEGILCKLNHMIIVKIAINCQLCNKHIIYHSICREKKKKKKKKRTHWKSVQVILGQIQPSPSRHHALREEMHDYAVMIPKGICTSSLTGRVAVVRSDILRSISLSSSRVYDSLLCELFLFLLITSLGHCWMFSHSVRVRVQLATYTFFNSIFHYIG